MTIVHLPEPTRVRVAITGDLDLTTADSLRERLDDLIVRYPDKDLILDLKDVPFIDSSGLGVILGRYRRLQDRGRRMGLIGVRANVRSVLDVAGVSRIISVGE
jgi:stage II sporulation protein AA (anti-sigma F factor antagonist)